MLTVFSGTDRSRISTAVVAALGSNYEVYEGSSLSHSDLIQIGQGTSLFSSVRRILVKDLAAAGSEVFAALPDLVSTKHQLIVWEDKLDKRTVAYKALVAAGVKLIEYQLPDPDFAERKVVFDILDTALHNGARAVKMVEKITTTQDPYLFLGLMVSQALKKYRLRQGTIERRTLALLAELDLKLKTTTLEPWTLIKAFLLHLKA